MPRPAAARRRPGRSRISGTLVKTIGQALGVLGVVLEHRCRAAPWRGRGSCGRRRTGCAAAAGSAPPAAPRPAAMRCRGSDGPVAGREALDQRQCAAVRLRRRRQSKGLRRCPSGDTAPTWRRPCVGKWQCARGSPAELQPNATNLGRLRQSGTMSHRGLLRSRRAHDLLHGQRCDIAGCHPRQPEVAALARGSAPADRARAQRRRSGSSRSTVRRVLQDFKRKRLITQTVGSGTYVSEEVHSALADLAPGGAAMATSPSELMSARLVLEPALIEMVIGNATAADFCPHGRMQRAGRGGIHAGGVRALGRRCCTRPLPTPRTTTSSPASSG